MINNFKNDLFLNCNIFNKIPLCIYLIFGIFLIYLLYKYFNSNNNKEIIDINNDSMSINHQADLIIYNFNTKWCYWSKHFRPEWDKFMDTVKKIKIQNPNFNVIAIDVDCDDFKNKKLINKYNIPGYPYILIESKDGETYEYENKRTSDELLQTITGMLNGI